MDKFDRSASAPIIKKIASTFGLSELFAELLVRRGLTTAESVRAFLSPSEEDIMDPFLLTGMKDAVTRIRSALENKERIVIYGDYDCDGIMATSILYGYLLSVGADVYYHIPNRFSGGYGVNTETLENIAETLFPDLIITVDCGISSAEEAEYLSEVLAIDLIVTDHHNLPDVLPNAIVVDPKLDPDTPCCDICGAGVAFKVLQALAGADVALQYVDLAAIATIADIVPLTKENRIIAYLGLKKINEHRSVNKGLRMLMDSSDREDHLDSSEVGFCIAPKINALGRIDDPREVVKLFVSDEYLEIQGLIDKVTKANDLRKSIVAEMYNEAIEMMKDIDLSAYRIIILYKSTWNVGVIGLVAARLMREFNRPTILFCGDEVLKGSARAPEGIDMYRTIKSAESLIETFGGHAGAAGLNVKRENLIEARNTMNDFLEKTYGEELFVLKPTYDLAVSASDITMRFAEELAMMEPTGEGNRKPTFKLDSSECPLTPMGGNAQHAKCKFNACTDVVAFGYSYLVEGIADGFRYDLITECNKEVYRNKERVQMRVLSAFASSFRLPDSDAIGFHTYLRSQRYVESQPKFTPIRFADIRDRFYDDKRCTLFLAFSAETAERALSVPGFRDKVLRVDYSKPTDLVSNTLVIAPDFVPVAYKYIVLLDTPFKTGYISYLNKHTNAEIFVVTDNYPFPDVIKRIDLSYEAVEKTFQMIRSFVYSGNGASGPMELFTKLRSENIYQTIAHFHILFDCGSIGVDTGFALSIGKTPDLTASTIYKRLLALKNKNERV